MGRLYQVLSKKAKKETRLYKKAGFREINETILQLQVFQLELEEPIFLL
jgi:hypothetical protein